ncbi:hypothetical protein H5410_049141 [Solanum commersonii]|uniref:NB-ARC domain-containing protein n=1 Tax=Solanum commersonii TaxID=4109 RepID=A0A9J5XK81_SOLCO|nr:hypothetical protein H5410_049141 [Solanum commersonii]
MSKSKSDSDFFVKPLLGNLEKELSTLISILEKELSSLSSIFRDVAKVHHEHKILKDLQRCTLSLAYESEVAIDSILAQYNAFLHIFCSLPTILKEIKHINAEVIEMWSADIPLNPHYVVYPFKHLPTRHNNPVTDEEIVAFEITTEKLIQYLTRGTSELDVIPIVGMGGQGKTTCARKVYNSDNIVSHFDVRAWRIVSQTYNRRELLQEIFSQVIGSKDKGDTDDVLADMLRRRLMGKRYLIVLDDMWDCMAWDDLRLSFPDVGNRSRIVVTTRLEEVGKQVKYHTDPYSLPFLTTEESCKLLQKKVFQKEDCPPELQDVSRAVAEKCKGLPLVVILVAGIIKKRKIEESWWNEPCLLYMGMFPEDARIPVSKLISLWIAEGFVENTESGRLMEEEAEGYLMDLISSNVISELRLLKVLDFSSFSVDFLSLATFKPLNHLKYLAVSAKKFYFHPESHLPHLETLIVKNNRSNIQVLQVSFWEMGKLRHVEIDIAKFDKQGIFEGSSELENLWILRNVRFPIEEVDMVDVSLRRCPNLQQLDITFEKDEDSAEPFCPKLENLTHLQQLQLSFLHPHILSGLQLPSNLNKLILNGMYMERAIPFIAGLPSLEYLQLQEGWYSTKRKPIFPRVREWCLGDITFHNLKLLKLVDLCISRWDASEKSFPLLETLVIKNCSNLEEIPLSFADIPLKQIKLIFCYNKSLQASAVRIKKEVEEIEGCDLIDLVKEY